MEAFASNQSEIHSICDTHFAYFKICIAREKLWLSFHYMQFYIRNKNEHGGDFILWENALHNYSKH